MKKNLLLLLLTNLIKSNTEENKDLIVVVTDDIETKTVNISTNFDEIETEEILTNSEKTEIKQDNVIVDENNIIEKKSETENIDTSNSKEATEENSKSKKTLTNEDIANFILVDQKTAKDGSIISIFSTSKEKTEEHKITIGVFNGKLSKLLKIGTKTVLKIRYNGTTEDSGLFKVSGNRNYIEGIKAVKIEEVK